MTCHVLWCSRKQKVSSKLKLFRKSAAPITDDYGNGKKRLNRQSAAGVYLQYQAVTLHAKSSSYSDHILLLKCVFWHLSLQSCGRLICQSVTHVTDSTWSLYKVHARNEPLLQRTCVTWQSWHMLCRDFD